MNLSKKPFAKWLEKGYLRTRRVAKRLGISDKSLYYWVSKAKVPAPVNPLSNAGNTPAQG